MTFRPTSAGGSGFRDGSVPHRGVRVWNRPVTEHVSASDFGDPGEPLLPADRLSAPRILRRPGRDRLDGCDPGIRATASPLSGPGGAGIPPSAVEVRWGVPDGYRGARPRDAPYFDGLAEQPPADMLLFKESAGSVQPVWVTVHVPADAAPGEYRGQVTLSAEGTPAVDVPLTVRVAGWQVPERPFSTIVDAVQSPDSVAMYYGVPLWSRRHWQLLDRSFRILGQAGCNAVTVTLIRRTHFGNEHGMVSWSARAGREPGAGPVHCRALPAHGGEASGQDPHRDSRRLGVAGEHPSHGWRRDVHHGPRDPHLGPDPRTGLLEDARGPPWGTPDCVELWRPAIDGLRDILARHGIADSLMLGVAGDRRPTEAAVETLVAAAPYAPWYVHSHGDCLGLHGQPVAYRSFVWPTGVDNPDDPGGPASTAFSAGSRRGT